VNVVVYIVLAVLPALLFLAAARALDWWTRGGRSPRSAEEPSGPPVERLVGDLYRLERDYTRIERSDLPRRALRLQSVSLAYDDTLCACCAALGVPVSSRPPFGAVERLEIEASLAQRGLTW